MGKTMREWQEIVDQWINEFGGGYWAPMSNLARVTEEVGELARLINHLYGEKRKKASEAEQELGIEISDIIFALICLANSQGIDLETSFEQMMTKLTTRDRYRYVPKGEEES
jgi:NTP pyrophosphatase (non-canonical NTP hydrolase)